MTTATYVILNSRGEFYAGELCDCHDPDDRPIVSWAEEYPFADVFEDRKEAHDAFTRAVKFCDWPERPVRLVRDYGYANEREIAIAGGCVRCGAVYDPAGAAK